MKYAHQVPDRPEQINFPWSGYLSAMDKCHLNIMIFYDFSYTKHTHTHVCMYYVHTHIHTHVCMYYVHTHTYTHVCMYYVHTHIHTHVCMYYVHTHTYTHVCMYYVHTHTHMYVYTNMYACTMYTHIHKHNHISGFFLGGGGGGHPPPLEDFVPPLGDPKKNCFRVKFNVLAFCSYLLQIPIRVILTCQISFQIALDATQAFGGVWGEDPPDSAKRLCSKCTGYYTSSSLCPPSKPKISILPPLGEFSKKNTVICMYYVYKNIIISHNTQASSMFIVSLHTV